MGWYRDLNYRALTTRGFLSGVALSTLGGIGEIAGMALYDPLPAWGNTLLTDVEALGLVVGLLAPLVFGIVLPLTE